MKKRMIIMTAAAMLAGMTACDNNSKNQDSKDTAESSIVTSSPEEQTDIETSKQEKKVSATEAETKTSDTETSDTKISSAETSDIETSAQEQNNAPDDNNPDNDNQNNDNQNNDNQNNDSQNDDTQPQETTEQPSEGGEFTTDDLVFNYNGNNIYLDENINDVKAKIGEPVNMIAAPSCYYDGDDKTFVYDGFSINTYPDGENDFVVSIELTEDNVSTVKGAKVGMTLEEALAIYGSNYTENGSNYQYQIDDKYMYFYVENGIVATIGIVYAN